MKLYVVQRSGVYDQGIAGIYDSAEMAKLAMKRAKLRERDNYHSFDIEEYTLNEFYNLKV